PLAGVTAGRLVFRRGASRVTIGSRAGADELFHARFEGPVPEVSVEGGTVSIRYRHLSVAEWARFALQFAEHGAEVALAPSVPWHIEVRGGISRLEADLADLQLTGVEVRGGASHVELSLGQPGAVVPVRVHGGVSHVTIVRPAGVAVRTSVRGGISK